MAPPRGPFHRVALLVLSLLPALGGCTDAPLATPDDVAAVARLLPVLRYAGDAARTGTPEEDALDAAFDRVDRFRLIVRRVATGALVLDTTLVVTPGADEYDLSVEVTGLPPGSEVAVVIVALEGETVLFESPPVTVATSEAGSADAPTPFEVELTYMGPGARATAVELDRAGLVLEPGGTAFLAARVRNDDASDAGDVPLAWSADDPDVAAVDPGGRVEARADGRTQVRVTTPTGLTATAHVYVVDGVIAAVLDGRVVETTMGGEPGTRGGSGGARGPAYSADGARLLWAEGGQVVDAATGPLAEGAWPALSPDGTKLAFERAGALWIANEDGSGPVDRGPGLAPAWQEDGEHLLLGGGSIERILGNGEGRETVVPEAGARLPSVGASGATLYVGPDGRVHRLGGGVALDVVVGSRATASPNGRWVAGAREGDGQLFVAPLAGGGPALPVDGLAALSDPVFRPEGLARAPGPPEVTALDPAEPVPGREASVLGAGFDWILPANTRVFFPTGEGEAEAEVRAVAADRIEVVVPRGVVAGDVRVTTRVGEAVLSIVPAAGTVTVGAHAPWDAPVEGVRFTLASATDTARLTTDAEGVAASEALPVGDYTLTVEPPEGFDVTGAPPSTVTVVAGESEVDVEVTPRVHALAFDELPGRIPVGDVIDLVVVATDIRGDEIPRVDRADWRSGSGRLDVWGSGLRGRAAGVSPGPEGSVSRFSVTVQGVRLDGSVEVRSFIAGTVAEPVVTPAPAGLARGGAPRTLPPVRRAAAGRTVVPSPLAAPPGVDVRGVTVQLFQGETLLAETTTGATGAFRFVGLPAGSYDVMPVAPSGSAISPTSAAVTLDDDNVVGDVAFTIQAVAQQTLTLSPPSSERLPGGTQRFTVTSGETGPFDWLVNGVVGGGATFGTIDTTGFYVAPGSVPSPASFPVCARLRSDPSVQGCATVTIEPIPTAGEDVVVFNDLNIFANDGLTEPNNHTLVRNIVNFTSSGPRASATRVLWDHGHNSDCSISTCGAFSSNMATTRSVIEGEGLTLDTIMSAQGTLVDIPGDVRVIWLWMPQVAYTRDEINALKQFAAEGGRIVFVGEHAGFYQRIDIENQFLADMGAQMTNVGAMIDCGFHTQPLSRIATHQVTSGLTAYRMACASKVVPGPNDFAILFASENGVDVPIAGVAKIDVTPLPEEAPMPSSRLRLKAPFDGPRTDDPTGADLIAWIRRR